ncbi:hypothetical protein [Methanofollis fontis]|nr:hypothetical protein [Methanofollis fontis]
MRGTCSREFVQRCVARFPESGGGGVVGVRVGAERSLAAAGKGDVAGVAV